MAPPNFEIAPHGLGDELQCVEDSASHLRNMDCPALAKRIMDSDACSRNGKDMKIQHLEDHLTTKPGNNERIYHTSIIGCAEEWECNIRSSY